MSRVQDKAHGYTGFMGPAESQKNPSTTAKAGASKGARVVIGAAFDNWRALKTAYGLKTDAEVALYLLDAMKRLPPSPTSAETSDLKTKSEVQTLIEREVNRAVAKNDTKLQGFIETIQQLNNDISLDSSIKNLEARINTVSRRAEVALSYIRKTQKKHPLPSLVNVDIIRGNPEDDAMETVPQNKKRVDCAAKSAELFRIMETTKNALKKIRRDKEAITTAIADLSPERPPPVLSPKYSYEGTTSSVADIKQDQPPPVISRNGSPERMGIIEDFKKEPEDDQEKENDDEQLKRFEPEAKRLKEDDASPDQSSSTGHKGKDTQQDWLYYPPLPPTTFPSVLSIEAASYSIPQRLEVNLALIRNPTRLSVLWNVTEEDPSAPPMESYSIFLTMENVKGSGVFPDWHTYDKVEAKALPMCALIKKYKPGHKVCAAVLGKDIFGRYGPYSKVVTATIPN
ncbi:uncharacterized protein atf7ip2 isoform X2 [Leuresthes tenuis]|uniref:uncharacterized protein atf7ip2 isoform X2 n=1 Tax=Leuresthes tenuis TaxID=355514 RepID=UPI003B501948